MFPGFALSSAPPSCHHDRGAGAADVDEGVIDLALARVQIWSVIASAEVEDPDLACTVVEAVLSPSADRPVVDESKGIRLWLGFRNV